MSNPNLRNRSVYLMRCKSWYKVGQTSNPEFRRMELQCGNPYPIALLCQQYTPSMVWKLGDVTSRWEAKQASNRVERHIHNLMEMEALERRREWFRFKSEEVAVNAFTMAVCSYE